MEQHWATQTATLSHCLMVNSVDSETEEVYIRLIKLVEAKRHTKPQCIITIHIMCHRSVVALVCVCVCVCVLQLYYVYVSGHSPTHSVLKPSPALPV